MRRAFLAASVVLAACDPTPPDCTATSDSRNANVVVSDFTFEPPRSFARFGFSQTTATCPFSSSTDLTITNTTAQPISFDYHISFSLNLASWTYAGTVATLGAGETSAPVHVTSNPAAIDLGTIVITTSAPTYGDATCQPVAYDLSTVNGTVGSCTLSDGKPGVRYQFDSPNPIAVQFTLSTSAFDPYLALRTASGAKLAFAPPFGPTTYATLGGYLPAGTYLLDADAAAAGQSGSFTLTATNMIDQCGRDVWLVPGCEATIAFNPVVCDNGGGYAEASYFLNLRAGQTVSIALQPMSTSVDPVAILLDGLTGFPVTMTTQPSTGTTKAYSFTSGITTFYSLMLTNSIAGQGGSLIVRVD
jgi:hypothetical protein